MPQLKITEASLQKIPKQDKLVSYFDTVLRGFGFYVTAKYVKTYFVKGRVNGKQVKKSIGKCSVISLKKARVEAQKLLAGMKEGKNPVEEERQKKVLGITLEDAFDGFLKERNNLKPGTVLTYRKLLNCHMKDWLPKPIAEITSEMIAARHEKITKESGKAPANNAMRTFRAIYNYARVITEEKIPGNPTRRLTAAKSWHKVDRRTTIISINDIPKWFEAVMAIENDLSRTYLLLLLFTGLRREEAAQLRWEEVDFSAKTLRVTDTKNSKPHILPLSGFLFDLLKDLRDKSTTDSPYVFPGEGRRGYISAPIRTMRRITEQTQVKFCIHDLRRTFSTIAENIVSYAQLKRLLNHSSKSDVTDGYLVITADALREPMEKITNKILFLANLTSHQNISYIHNYVAQNKN